jgi:hypothetical protein
MNFTITPAANRNTGRGWATIPSGWLPSMITVGLGLLLGCGCGRSGPVVQFVEGRVVLDGQALEGATVGLSPVAGSQGLPAYARTDTQGIFRVTSTRGGRRDAGAAEGDYIVTISKVVADEADVAVEAAEPGERPKPAPSRKSPRNVVPEVYAEVDTSPLRATIQRGANTGPAFVFDLNSSRAIAGSGKR